MARSVRLVPLESQPALAHEAIDPNDLDQVYRCFAPYITRVAGRILGHGDEVPDLVQDVFLDAHRGLGSLRDAAAVRRWLVTVTIRKAYRRLRRRSWTRAFGLDTPIDPSRLLDPTASAATGAWVVAVYRILDTVSTQARIAWVMHRVEDEPLEMVAEVCGCSRATAHRLVRQAQQALEEGLGDVGDA